MVHKRISAIRHLPALAIFAVCACCFGQSDSTSYRQPVEIVQGQPQQPQASATPAPATPSSTKPAAGTTTHSSATPYSVLNQPAHPAKIDLSAGRLSIQADNSSLSEILLQVSKDSGMKIEGLQSGGSPDQRIFGTYGPGTPRDVLSDLLSGCGFNVLMLGVTPSGAPRELALTSPTAGPGPGATPPPGAAPDQGQPDQPQPVMQEQQPTFPQQPGTPGVRNGVKTPQQMLEELQRMRQQQEQQQQDQQQEQQPDQDQQDPQPDPQT